MRLKSCWARLFEICAAMVVASFAMSPAAAQTPSKASAAGFWQSNYDDGNPSGWFYFTEHNGVFEGRLVKMFKKMGEERLVEFCSECPGAMKNAPMLGLTIVTGMKRNGLKYEDGNILDPRDGSVYSAEMEVSPDNQNLYVRGYLGISLLGQTQTWIRLPDDAIPAAAIPVDPVAAAAAKKPPAPTPAKTLPTPHKTPAPPPPPKPQ
jgi:uncharacterized protein (DUF2147 family)